MCGIAGIADFGGRPDADCLRRMVDSQRHRGPDDSGIYLDGPFGLGHTRLSIIDPESGAQPLSNEDGTVWVTFNGEIYNHHRLRESLDHHRFETQTDTEVLVHLYEEHGLDFLERLEGMFALAVLDTERDRLVLARDRMGIKPVHLARDGDELAFASELKPLVDSGPDPGGLDRQAISLYFTFGFIPSPYTIYENVRKLRPGERAVVTSDAVEFDRYFEPSLSNPDLHFSTAASELRRRVTDAVEKRLMSDVPLGAFLSGGIDSSILVGVMARLMDEPVQTYTVGFDVAEYDESWAAAEVAEYHGTDHHEYTVSPDDVRECIPEVISRFGEPFADASIIPTYVVSREASSDLKVALSGDGADELFAGYNKYRGEHASRYYRKIPRHVRRVALEKPLSMLARSRAGNSTRQIRMAAEFASVAGESDATSRHLEWFQLPDDVDSIAGLGARSTAKEFLATERSQNARALPDNLASDDLAVMLATDPRSMLPDGILTKVDLASMYNSLEVRVPMLDCGVVEYALSVPTEYKITPRRRKWLLRAAFDDMLPESIKSRKKHGFEMPIGEWFRDELHDDFVRTVESIDVSTVDIDHVMKMFESHVSGSERHDYALWSVYVFGKWANQAGN